MLICTKRIFLTAFRCTGFIGEGQKDFNAVLAVKTHDPIGEYDAAILLIRNPYCAMMSYHTWKVTKSHVIRAGMYVQVWVPADSALIVTSGPQTASIH